MDAQLPTSKSTLGDLLTLSGDFFSAHWQRLLEIICIAFVPAGILTTGFTMSTDNAFVSAGEYPSKIPAEKVMELLSSNILGLSLGLLLVLWAVIGGIWSVLAVTYYVKNALEKKELTAVESYTQSGKLFFSNLFTELLKTILLVLLFILLIIPGIIFTIYWAFTLPILVFTGKTFFDNYSYSMQLVKNNWWRMLGYGIVFSIIAGIISGILTNLATFIFSIVGLGNFADIITTPLSQYVAAFILVANVFVFLHLEALHGEKKEEHITEAA